MPFAIVSIVIQALAIIHVLRTGRDMRWIFLIVFVPVAGAAIYFVMEVMPTLNQNITARRAVRRVRDVVDPERGVREAMLDYERNPTVETASRLADELTGAGRFEEAIGICERARTGLFVDDPKILLSLANAQFGAARYPDTVATLDRLRDKNPDFRSADGHLVYARALAASGATQRALEEYEALAGYYPGAEARVRQALLHKELGMTGKARAMFEAILKDARLAPDHFRRSQREWLDMAQRESADLPRGGAT